MHLIPNPIPGLAKDPTSASLLTVTALPPKHANQIKNFDELGVNSSDREIEQRIPEENNRNENDEFPDGGKKAWLAILGSFLVNCMSWGYPATYGVYQLYYATVALRDHSIAAIAWPGSAQLFLAFLLCAPAGRLADAGFVRRTVAVGGILTVVGTLLTAEAAAGTSSGSGWGYGALFAVQGIVTGLGLGLMFMPGVSVVASYWRRYRSFALAASATGTGVGSVVFPAIVQYLIPRVGFAWAVRTQALVSLAMVAGALAALQPRLKPRIQGDWIEWKAFREIQYSIYSLGCWLTFWAMHFGFFYVGSFLFIIFLFLEKYDVTTIVFIFCCFLPLVLSSNIES